MLAVCLLPLPTDRCRRHCHSIADTTDWGFFWLGLIFPLAWLIGFLRPLFRHPHFPQRQNFIGWIGNVVGKYYSDWPTCFFPFAFLPRALSRGLLPLRRCLRICLLSELVELGLMSHVVYAGTIMLTAIAVVIVVIAVKQG